MNKVEIVTGATSGIGQAITEMLLNKNIRVLVNGRTSREQYIESDVISVSDQDLLNTETPNNILEQALTKYGRIDYVFINAGIIESANIKEINIEKMCKMVRLKVESSFRLIYTILKYFIDKNSGHIFITSSVLGTKTRENSGAYAACNYALEALAESLRMELSDTNIQITCIEPGLVKTNLHKDWPIHPKELLGITNTLTPRDIADSISEIMDKPDHIRIPRYMILPKGHKI